MSTINTVTHVHGPRGWDWPRQPDQARDHLASCHSLEGVSYRDAVAIHQDRHDYVRPHTHSQVPNPLDPDAWYWPRSSQEAADHLGTHHGEPGLQPADNPLDYHGVEHRKDPTGEALARRQAERDRTRTRQAQQDERDRAADALGHDSTCRRRNPSVMGADSRGIDPENCERCRFLQAQLDQAQNRREQAALYADTMADEARQHAFTVGETVQVHAFGHWYTGEVQKATAKTVTVRYTSGAGVTRDKTVPNPTRPDLDGLNTSQVLVRPVERGRP